MAKNKLRQAFMVDVELVIILVINLSLFMMYTFRCLQNLICIFVLLVAFPGWNLAQDVKILSKGIKTSLRGLSVVTNNIVWASGSHGRVAKTTDGGNSFQWFTVKGYEQRDFRDVHGFDSMQAIIIAIDTPSVILKTKDGGLSWYKVFEDKRPGMFLDAMHFEGKQGVVVGDPIDGKPFMASTNDYGETWQVQEFSDKCQQTINGEAFFAASGTNIQLIKSGDKFMPLYVSGGVRSRLFYLNDCLDLPMQSGKNYTGANGLVYDKRLKKGVVVGGDFSDPKRSDSAMVFFELNKSMSVGQPIAIPSGYKSGVTFLKNGDLILCGTTGIAKWNSKSGEWLQLSDQSAHTVQADKKYKYIYLCGSNGFIGKIINK